MDIYKRYEKYTYMRYRKTLNLFYTTHKTLIATQYRKHMFLIATSYGIYIKRSVPTIKKRKVKMHNPLWVYSILYIPFRMLSHNQAFASGVYTTSAVFLPINGSGTRISHGRTTYLLTLQNIIG